MFEKKHTMF